MTLSILTIVIMTISLALSITISKAQHWDKCHFNATDRNAEGRILNCYAECRYAECHCAECRYAECRYAECCYAECRYAARRGAGTP